MGDWTKERGWYVGLEVSVFKRVWLGGGEGELYKRVWLGWIGLGWLVK